MKRHISLAGLYAGVIACGQEELKEGETKAHPGRWLDNPDLQDEICPDCLKLWEEASL